MAWIRPACMTVGVGQSGSTLSTSTPLVESPGTNQVRTYHRDDPAHPSDVTSVTDADGKLWSSLTTGAGAACEFAECAVGVGRGGGPAGVGEHAGAANHPDESLEGSIAIGMVEGSTTGGTRLLLGQLFQGGENLGVVGASRTVPGSILNQSMIARLFG